MRTFFYWSGVAAWAAAALVIAWWAVQIVGELASARVSFGKFNPGQPIIGRHPGSLATLVPPYIHVRIPFTSFGGIIVTISERRWARRWPRLNLPHLGPVSGELAVWPPGYGLYVARMQLPEAFDPTPVRAFAAQTLALAANAGVTVHRATDSTLPAAHVTGRHIVLFHASDPIDDLTGLAKRLSGHGCQIIYAADTVNPWDTDDTFDWETRFQFPHRSVSVQVADDAVYVNGNRCEWPDAPAPTFMSAAGQDGGQHP